MASNELKLKDRSWWMFFLIPLACWLSGWLGVAGLVLGSLASIASFRLMVSPLNKKVETAAAMQIEILKGVLLRFLSIIVALTASVCLDKFTGKQGALYWAGGAVLLGQALMITSAAIRQHLGGENHGRD